MNYREQREWWNVARVEELTALWNSGKPASEIAREMGTTKSAIVGKANRMKLTPRRDPVVKPQGITPRELATKSCVCVYPSGDPRDDDFSFCSEPSVPGHSYCAPHRALCSSPAPRRRPGIPSDQPPKINF